MRDTIIWGVKKGKGFARWLPRDEPISSKPFGKIDYLCGLLVLFVSFGVYLHTLAPTVTSGDVGDHITCAWLLSIPHPTGYPLYMTLAHLFCQIPIGNIAYRMNFFSAFFGSLSIMLIFFLTRRLYQSTASNLISIFSSLLFGFSWVFWSQSLMAEVYTLNIFFISLILFLLLREKIRSSFLLLGFVCGIGLSHHLSILFILPGTLLFILINYRRYFFNPTRNKGFNSKIIGFFFLFLATGLLLWLYLPITSAKDPFLAWGHITNLKEFLYFATGKEFTQQVLSSSYSVKEAKWFVHLIFNQFSYLFLIGFFGLFFLAKKHLRLFIFFLTTITINILFSLNYHIYDIEVYYLPTFFILVLLIGYGIDAVLKRTRSKIVTIVSSVGLIALLIGFLLRDWSSVNINDYYHVYDYGRNILKTVPERTILFDSSHVGYFSLWYLLVCEEPERNVCVVPQGWLNKPWTIERFKKRHLWLRTTLKDELKDKYGLYTNIQSVYENILMNNIKDTPIYYVYGSGLKNPYTPIIEEGIISTHQGEPTKTFEYLYRSNKREYKDYWAKTGVSTFYNNLGGYYYRIGKYKESLSAFEISAMTDPQNVSILTNLATLYYFNKDFNQAASTLKKILQLNPNDTHAKQMLEAIEQKISLDKN